MSLLENVPLPCLNPHSFGKKLLGRNSYVKIVPHGVFSSPVDLSGVSGGGSDCVLEDKEWGSVLQVSLDFAFKNSNP